MVGVDGSPESREALAFALAEARQRGARLQVIHAWSFPNAEGEIQQLAAEAAHQPLAQAAQDTLDATLGAASEHAADVEIDARTVEGHPAQVLVDAARDADLLVVGSRGRGGFAGLLLGSVSGQCVHHAGCPVVVVPQKPASA